MSYPFNFTFPFSYSGTTGSTSSTVGSTIDAPIEGATMLALNQLAFGVERLQRHRSLTLICTSGTHNPHP